MMTVNYFQWIVTLWHYCDFEGTKTVFIEKSSIFAFILFIPWIFVENYSNMTFFFRSEKSHVLIILNLQWNKTKLKQKRKFYVCYARRLKDVNINNKKKEDVIYDYPWDMYPQISKNKDVKNYRNKFTLYRICIISCEKEWIWCINSWQNITTCSWRKKLEKERKDIILWLLSFI